MNLPPTRRKLAGRGVTFSRALLKDGNFLSRPQPEAVLAPVSYRSSRRRRQRKRLLLKVPINCIFQHTSVVEVKQPVQHYDNIYNVKNVTLSIHLWFFFFSCRSKNFLPFCATKARKNLTQKLIERLHNPIDFGQSY